MPASRPLLRRVGRFCLKSFCFLSLVCVGCEYLAAPALLESPSPSLSPGPGRLYVGNVNGLTVCLGWQPSRAAAHRHTDTAVLCLASTDGHLSVPILRILRIARITPNTGTGTGWMFWRV